MSQVLLGFRNLAFRIAVFVALAALLVWFLGGTLTARNDIIVISTASTGPGDGQVDVRLEQVVVPLSKLPSERTYLQVSAWDRTKPLQLKEGWQACATQDLLRHATGLLAVGQGATDRAVWFAGEPLDLSGAWRIYRIEPWGSCPERMLEVGDRLEAERQLARVAAGLPLQPAEQARAARDAVLRAGDAP
ncbi:MAG: hypothetical protein ACKOYN_02400 [Planctomycetota bacterium]